MATKIKRDYKNKKAYLVHTTEIYMSEDGSIQWMVHFESGGWNSVWAKTEKQALRKAKKEHSSNNCVVASVSVMTPSKEKAAMSNFY